MTKEQKEPFVVGRRNVNLVRTIIAGIVGPLVVATILGYVTLNTTINKLTSLAELSDRRLNIVESDFRKHEVDYRDLQIAMVKQGQILEDIYKELVDLKGAQRAGREKDK